MALYCGIDIGKQSCDIAVINNKGELKKQARVKSNILDILDCIKPYKKTLRIVFESCSTYYWLSDGLTDAGYKDITMAHALKLKHITQSKIKTDKRDSIALAELHRANYIPTGYIFPKELRPARDLTRLRMSLVNKRAGEYKNLKMLLTRHGLGCPKRSSIPNLDYEDLEAYSGIDIHMDHTLKGTVDINNTYTEHIKSIEEELEEYLKDDEIVERLCQIPGVGKTISKAIRLEVNSVDRFKNIKHFCSWARVVPGVSQSGGSCTRGRGSKQGNAFMKNALMQAASSSIRFSPRVKAYYEFHKSRRRSSSGTLVSLNIIAHKLCVGIWHIFQGREYDESKIFSIENLTNG